MIYNACGNDICPIGGSARGADDEAATMSVESKFANLRLAFVLGLLLLAACSGAPPATTAEPTVFVPIIGTPQGLFTPPAIATNGAEPGNTPAAGSTAAEAGTTNGETVGAAPWLTGRFIVALGGQGIFEIALPSGATTTLFQSQPNTWLTAMSARASDGVLAVAYAPPPPEGMAQLGYTSIYLLPGDCQSRANGCGEADFQPVVEQANPNEAFFSPVWSPTGDYLYFAHFTPSDANSSTPFHYTLERLVFANDAPIGEPELVAEDALWPAVSPDGRQIAYIYSDPVNYTNHLIVAEADGAHPTELVGPETFQAIDSPLFSADGSQIIFSAVDFGTGLPTQTPVSWLDWLLGVRVAEAAPPAHNVPSDWWIVPTQGGTPTRLTQVADTGMFGDIGPDGEHLAYLSASGLYVIGVDGTELMRLSDKGGYGTLEWLP